MAKTLKQILDGVKSSKTKNKDVLGTKPGVDYAPKAGDERKFADKHEIEKHADRVGNGDDVYQGTNVKYSMDTPQMKNFGHKPGEDEKVYESSKCNMSEAGTMCEVHGMKKCPSMKEEAKCNMTKEGTECPVHGMAECWKGGMIKEKPVKEDLDPYNPKDIGFDFKYGGHLKGRKAEVHRMPGGHYEVRKYKNPGAGLGTGEHVETVKHTDRVKAGIEAQRFATAKEEVEQVDEAVKTTHENPLVSVYTKDGLHTHANLSTANSIHNTNVKHKDVHRGPVTTNSGWEHKRSLRFELSPHHIPHMVRDANEEVKLDEFLVQNYVSGTKDKRAEVHKLQDGSFEVKKYSAAFGGNLVNTTKHDMPDDAHAAAKKHLGEGYGTDLSRGLSAASLIKKHGGPKVHFTPNGQMIHSDSGKVITPNSDQHSVPELIKHAQSFKEEVELDEKAIARGKQTMLVTMKSDPHSRSGGAVKRIKKSEYDPKIHSLAEDQDLDEGMKFDRQHSPVPSMRQPSLKAHMDAADWHRGHYEQSVGADEKAYHKDRMLHHNSQVHAMKSMGVKEEAEQIEERKLTPGETKKREEVVMSLKKKLGDFRKRYGKERGKSVMYATATKVAKNMKEDLAQPLVGSAQPRGNSDEAADMVKTELRALANKAMHLVMNMPQGMHVEPWVQAKIAQAKEMVSSVHDYMIYGDHKEEDEQATADTPSTFPNYNVDPGATGIGQNI